MKPTVLGYVTCPYGKKGSWMAGYHTGIDYRAPTGTNILSTKRGTVVHAGYGGSYGPAYGNYVVIQTWHYGRKKQHLYAHLSKSLVKTGDRVQSGQIIGKSGTTGNTFGPHLHYEERYYPFNYWAHTKPVLPEWQPIGKKIQKKLKKKKNK